MDITSGVELQTIFPNPRYRIDAAVEPLRKAYWNIEPNAGLYLGTDVAENSEQFAMSFREAWMTVNDTDRKTIVDAWVSAHTMLYPWIPCISMAERTPWPAECSNGIYFQFNSSVVDRMPSELVQPLIGHELGHAIHFLTASPSHSCLIKTPEQRQKREDDANAIARTWGFRVDDLMDWSNAHRDVIQPFVINDVSSGW